MRCNITNLELLCSSIALRLQTWLTSAGRKPGSKLIIFPALKMEHQNYTQSPDI